MIISTTVCYQPNLTELGVQLRALSEQVDCAIVVHNGESDADLESLCAKFGAQLLSLGSNKGLALAQNIAMELAVNQGADAILLMDQDSVPAPGMVARLKEVLNAHHRAAAASPSILDLRSNHVSYFQVEGQFWPLRWRPGVTENAATVEAALFIASGMLIRVEALADIGMMKDEWFIDQIDTEWCLRARSKGWTLIGVASAQLGHRLGDRVATVWLLRTRHVAFHSPQRNYYMFRNLILLMQLPYVSYVWRVHFLWRIMRSIVFFLMFAPQRVRRIAMICKGIRHGMQGQTGEVGEA